LGRQEALQKDIERAFGVLQQKFQVLRNVIETWFLSEIKEIVETCIMLHNMMVESRICNDEKEDSNFYTMTIMRFFMIDKKTM
jgi:Plant transposon protein